MRKEYGFRLLPIAGAMLMAFGHANAQVSDDVLALTTPQSSVSVGVGGVLTGDANARRFGVYSGMNKGEPYGLFDLNFVKRNDETGTWIIVDGRDLGLETRELSFTHQRQGDWKYTLEYNEIVRHDPYTIHTGMTGVGTANPVINLTALPATAAQRNGATTGGTAAASDIELKIKRTAFGVSAEKWLSPAWQLEASFRTEHRKGARLFGRAGLNSNDMSQNILQGTGNANGRWAVLLTPEPIDSRTNIFEGKVSFNHEKLALTAGYYGTFFNNDFGSLSPSVPGTLNRGVLWNGANGSALTIQQNASSPIALPPDNQAHQLFLSGVYSFSKDTRANMKFSYTHATQDESFASQGLTPAATAPSSLGGEVNTLLAMLGLSSRVTSDFSVKANLRYEDRDDKTPVYVYNTSGTAGNLNNTTNWPSASQTRTTAKLEGTYRLPYGYSAVFGADWERKKAPLPIANTGLFNQQVFFREQLDEYGLRGELRKALSETLNGSVSLEYKERRGGDGDWKTAATSPGAIIPANPATLNRVFPDMYMNRDRTKARVSVDWTPIDPLDLQLVYEHIEDQYKRPSPATTGGIIAGARTVSTDSVSLDGGYTITENWKVNAYVTESEYRWNVNKAGILEDTRGSSQTVGMAVKGKISSKVDVGADFLTSRDRTTFTNQVNGVSLAANYLPAISYTVDRVKLFANYALNKDSDIRFDAIYQHYHTDDWQWGYNGVPFLYSDNTTVSQPMTQNFGFAGARYIYKF
jgi:MtrB/PioB family decaheme-associated outer membrane protein